MRLKSTTIQSGQPSAVGGAPEAAEPQSGQPVQPGAAPVDTAAEAAAVDAVADTAAESAAQNDADIHVWAATFPHLEIDELMTRVGAAGAATPAETTALLGAIIDEARRLRATVVRLTAEKLSAAEKEAEQILAEARAEAAELRRSANEAMINRLDEAESAGDAITQAATVDATRRSRQGQQLLAQTRTEVEELRARVSAIFDSTNGILPLLGEAATALGRMETELAESVAPAPEFAAAAEAAPAADVPSDEAEQTAQPVSA